MKKNWKKLIALGLGVMMLAGCGASNQSGAAETTTETAQESSGSTTETRKSVLYLFYCG